MQFYHRGLCVVSETRKGLSSPFSPLCAPAAQVEDTDYVALRRYFIHVWTIVRLARLGVAPLRARSVNVLHDAVHLSQRLSEGNIDRMASRRLSIEMRGARP
jgi:hypothetical protein